MIPYIVVAVITWIVAMLVTIRNESIWKGENWLRDYYLAHLDLINKENNLNLSERQKQEFIKKYKEEIEDNQYEAVQFIIWEILRLDGTEKL